MLESVNETPDNGETQPGVRAYCVVFVFVPLRAAVCLGSGTASPLDIRHNKTKERVGMTQKAYGN